MPPELQAMIEDPVATLPTFRNRPRSGDLIRIATNGTTPVAVGAAIRTSYLGRVRIGVLPTEICRRWRLPWAHWRRSDETSWFTRAMRLGSGLIRPIASTYSWAAEPSS